MDAFETAQKSITISKDGKTVTTKGGGGDYDFGSAFGRIGMAASSKEKYKWKLTCKGGRGGMFIGIQSNRNVDAYYDEIDYGYDGCYGKKCHLGKEKEYGIEWGAGDMIEMRVDFERQEMGYSVNGIDQGIAFRNLRLGQTYYLVVGMSTEYKGNCIVLNQSEKKELDDEKKALEQQTSTFFAKSGIGQLTAILDAHLKLMKNKDAAVEKIISGGMTASSLFAAKKKALANEKCLLLSIMDDIDEMNTFLKNIILIENLFNAEYQPFKKKQEAARRKYAPNISKYENKPKCLSEAGSFVELIFAGNTHLSSFGTWLDKVLKQCAIEKVQIKSFSGAKGKKMERAFYKAFYVYSENDNNGFKKMTDMLRCSLVFETFEDLYKCFSVIEMLAKQSLDGGILRVKDRYNPSTMPFGYRDLLINVRCPESTIVAEIQLHFIAFYKYKKISHTMYKKARLFQRETGNLAYQYSTKYVRAKIGDAVYKVSKDEIDDGEHKSDEDEHKSDEDDGDMEYAMLLKQWGLQKYTDKMKEEGWDDPTYWRDLTDEDLKNDIGFSKGHIRKFKGKYKKYSESKKD